MYAHRNRKEMSYIEERKLDIIPFELHNINGMHILINNLQQFFHLHCGDRN